MKRSHLPRLALLLLAASLGGCDQRGQELPTGAPTATAEAAADLAPLMAAGADSIPGRYVVVLDPAVASAEATAENIVAAAGGEVIYTYEHVFKGFAATLPPAGVEQLRNDPQVQYVVPDAWAYPTTNQSNPTWGLDRIDQRSLPLNAGYVYGSTGAGVRVYVIDTGIRTAHAQFGGRASVGADFVGGSGQDCNGHGTHVAGTIAGSTYGVAKATQVVAVRVFGCSGPSPVSTIIAAVNWVTGNAVRPAVVNMSLGSGFHAPLNLAVQNSVASGLVYTVAAGNENGQNACNFSPASTPQAITVGASNRYDVRATFSNRGSCLDLFAPGQDIVSAWYSSNTAIASLSGTSMAAPHVAGVAALYLQDRPGASPGVVAAAINGNATYGKLSSIGSGSPNRLLFSSAPPVAPGSVAAVRVGAGRIVVTWVDSSTNETSFTLQRRTRDSSGSWGSYVHVANLAANRTSFTDSRLTEGRGYRYRVRACNPAGCSDWEASAVAELPRAPTAPSNAVATAVSPTVVQLRWSDNSTNEDTFTVHRAEVNPDGVTWGPFAHRATLAARSTRLVDSTVITGRRYRYRVRACNVAGCSAWANSGSVLLPLVPAAPANFTATALSPTSIRLAWTDESTIETRIELYRAVRNNGIWGPWQRYATLPRNARSFTDLVDPGGTYQYRITACNGAGCAHSVSSVAVTTPLY